MATGIFAVLKNISILADDVSTIGQTSLKNTVGILGDDLAIYSEKASRFSASRELPVVYAITIGSFKNKVIVVSILMPLFYFAALLIKPILISGGLFLAYEGAHGIIDLFFFKTNKR